MELLLGLTMDVRLLALALRIMNVGSVEVQGFRDLLEPGWLVLNDRFEAGLREGDSRLEEDVDIAADGWVFFDALFTELVRLEQEGVV